MQKVFEGVAVIAAGSINPPDPSEGCRKAKLDATTKAAQAGYRGAVAWERLSVDSDCSLSTTGGRTTGYFFTFTAKGTFSQA